jgi:ankyrin repeat protein
MRTILVGSALALAVLPGGCAGDTAPVGTALTAKDIGISLELAQQDKDGFPHAFRVTFENRSDRDGFLTLPVPLPGRAESILPLPPTIFLGFGMQDGRELYLTYTAAEAMDVPHGERVRLRPGGRCVREYAAADFCGWGHSGPIRRDSFGNCFRPGATPVQVRALYVVGYEEDRPEEAVRIDSEAITMRCSFDEAVFAEERQFERPTTPLHQAVRQGDVQAVERLVAQGADVNATDEYKATPLHLAAEKGRTTVAEMLLDKGAGLGARDSGGNTPLHIAAIYGNVDMMKLLIAKGAEVDASASVSPWTPLHAAALQGQVEAAKLLLAAGADPNAKADLGDTPLCFAAMKGYDQVVALLLGKGAEVSARGNNGLTALHYAAGKGYKVVVEGLLAGGADVTAKDNNGNTPLALAATNGREKTAEVLLAHGADPNVTDDKGRTPLALATEKGYKGLVKLLEEHGAKE